MILGSRITRYTCIELVGQGVLDKRELFFIANKKSTDQHIVYLGWSLGEEKDEVAVIEIERDTRLPRIELQENDDDNLILGMCTDKVSRGWIRHLLGQIHTSLCCILMCLTVERELVMFDALLPSSPQLLSQLASKLIWAVLGHHFLLSHTVTVKYVYLMIDELFCSVNDTQVF